MKSIRTHIGKGGRIVLPATYRRAMRLHPGDEVVLVLDDNELRLVPPSQAVKKAQALVRQFVPAGRRLAKELIQERRQEARRDSRGTRKDKG